MTQRDIGVIVFALIFIVVFWIGCGFAHKNPKDEKSLITVPNWVSKLYLSKRKDSKLIFTLMVNEVFVVLVVVLATCESTRVLQNSFVGPALLVIAAFPADLYLLTAEQLLTLEGFAELSTQNLLNAIEASTQPSLARFIYALGIPNVGEETAKLLARSLGSLTRISQALPSLLSWGFLSPLDIYL